MRSIVISITALAACGSGSGSDTATAPEPLLDRAYRTLATYNSVVTTNFHALGEALGMPPICGRSACYTDRQLADGLLGP